MLLPMEDKVRVNLIGNHQHMVLMADFNHFLQLFFFPNQSQRIMGITKNENLGFLCLLFKVCKIHLPSVFLFH